MKPYTAPTITILELDSESLCDIVIGMATNSITKEEEVLTRKASEPYAGHNLWDEAESATPPCK